MIVDTRLNCRLRSYEMGLIERVVEKEERYDTISHFVRCAIIRLLRTHYPEEMRVKALLEVKE